MAHFALLWKARTIEKYRQDYENEKINSIIMSNADIPQKTLFQRWRHYSHDVQKRLSRTFSKWYPEGSTMSNFLVHFRAESRFPHILLRSLFGFIGGLVLTYLCFVFLVFQLSLSLVHATVLSSLFGILITLGLTFSNRVRCLVFLLIPQLFSRAGRYTLTCYALVLILTGPATNTLNNSEVLSESMACSQGRIKADVEIINGSMKKPINSIKDSIKFIVEQAKQITAKLKLALLRTNRMILSIAALIQSNFSWLGSMSESCNTQLGSPTNRCMNLVKATMGSCKECYNKHSWYYTAASVAQVACSVLRPYKKFCVAADFAEETFYATVRKKLKTFADQIGKIIFLKIHTHHSYTFIGNTSTPSQVAAGIVTEIRKRADPILTWLSWSSCVTSLFLLLIIFRAKHYQQMYLTRSRFDNRYITKEFREMDLKRMREGRKTVLPLNRRERLKYVTTTSFRLVASEKMYLNRSALFMMITTFKLLIHIVADYSLYWVLMTIQYHGRLQSPLQPQLPATGVQIIGSGFVSRLLQSLIDTLNIPLQLSTMSSKSCLPIPNPPDFKRYGQITTLILLLWFFALFEPYGLRLRHLIMGHYKPERAKTRAGWLYNHILKTRGSFMKFARRKVHREYKYVSESKLTFRRWLLSIIPFKWLQWILGIHSEEPRCLLCSAVEDVYNSHTELIRCEVPTCPGTYCSSCFSDIGQMCTICLSPADYGDLSDVSLEKGSDEDDDDENQHGTIARKKEHTLVIEDSQSDASSKMLGNYDLDTCLEHETDNESNGSKDNAIDYEMYPLRLPCDNTLIKKSSTSDNENSVNYFNFVGLVTKRLYEDTVKTSEIFVKFNVRHIKSSKHILCGMLHTIFNNILKETQGYYMFYNFYRISIPEMSFYIVNEDTSKLHKILRNGKLSRKKGKATMKIHQVVNYGNCKEKQGFKVSKGDKRKDNSSKKFTDPNPSKLPWKQSKQEKMSNNVNKLDKRIPICDTHSSTLHLKRSNFSFSNYWNSISRLLSCNSVSISDTINDLKPMEGKKHKRKKKHKKTKHSGTKKHESKNDETRQYRLHLFLADQFWRKASINDEYQNEAATKINKISHKTNEIEVNNVKIPRLDLRFSSESIDTLNSSTENATNFKLQNLSELDMSNEKKKDFTFWPFGRFLKRMSSAVLGSESLNRTKHTLSPEQSFSNHIVCDPISCEQKAEQPAPENGSSFENTLLTGNDKVRDQNKTKEDKMDKKSKKSLIDLTIKKSNVKRQTSEKLIGYNGFKGPITLMKDLYTSIFTASCSTFQSDDIKECEEIKVKGKADKQTAARPSMMSCACQQSKSYLNGRDRCIQVEQKHLKRKKKLSVKEFRDAEVSAMHATCTCATQYYVTRNNIHTLPALNLHHPYETPEIVSEYSSSSDDTNTDTTTCRLTIVDHRDTRANDKIRKMKINVVTKQNQSTLTERANVCNISTGTDDWWSPIFEKKEISFKSKIKLEQEEVNVSRLKRKIDKRDQITLKTKAIETDGKYVTFRSQAQIIPPDSVPDILSPTRYLLESQKYYNELFTSKYYAPRIFPVSHVLKYRKCHKSRSPLNHYQCRRSRRFKVLEWTPRKDDNCGNLHTW